MKKNDAISSEFNHENDKYSMLKRKILPAIKFYLIHEK